MHKLDALLRFGLEVDVSLINLYMKLINELLIDVICLHTMRCP